MRILLVTDGIYPLVMGGMQRHSYNLAIHLAKSGVEVDLYHCSENANASDLNNSGFKAFLDSSYTGCHFPKKIQFRNRPLTYTLDVDQGDGERKVTFAQL